MHVRDNVIDYYDRRLAMGCREQTFPKDLVFFFELLALKMLLRCKRTSSFKEFRLFHVLKLAIQTIHHEVQPDEIPPINQGMNLALE
jgi:hypothetical protein